MHFSKMLLTNSSTGSRVPGTAYAQAGVLTHFWAVPGTLAEFASPFFPKCVARLRGIFPISGDRPPAPTRPPPHEIFSRPPATLLPPSWTLSRRALINTGALTTSSLWRVVISFALLVLIADRLDVVAAGQYQRALAFLNVAQVLSELGLPALLARDLARSPAGRAVAWRISLRMQLIASLLVWGGLLALSPLLANDPTTSPVMRPLLLLVGATLPFYAVTSSCQTIFQAAERMELIMGVEVVINTLIIGVSAVILWTGGGVVALLGLLVCTQATSAALCLLILWRVVLSAEGGVRSTESHAHSPTPHSALRTPHFLRQALPFYTLSLADVMLHRLDILLLGFVAGPVVVGLYALAYAAVRVLMKLIQSYWRALYPTLSRLRQQAPARYAWLSRSSLLLSTAGLIAAALVGTFFAAELLDIIYQPQDIYPPGTSMNAVQPFAILVWIGPIFGLEMYAITQLLVRDRARQGLLPTALHVLALAVLLPPLTAQMGAAGAALAVLAGGVAGTILGWWLLRRGEPQINAGKRR